MALTIWCGRQENFESLNSVKNALEKMIMKGKVNTMENRIYDEKNGLWYEKQGD